MEKHGHDNLLHAEIEKLKGTLSTYIDEEGGNGTPLLLQVSWWAKCLRCHQLHNKSNNTTLIYCYNALQMVKKETSKDYKNSMDEFRRALEGKIIHKYKSCDSSEFLHSQLAKEITKRGNLEDAYINGDRKRPTQLYFECQDLMVKEILIGNMKWEALIKYKHIHPDLFDNLSLQDLQIINKLVNAKASVMVMQKVSETTTAGQCEFRWEEWDL